jgi:SNF2 family DNA or RNA helicase
MPTYQPGTRLRLIADPGRIGVMTGRTRSRGSRTFWEIVFPDGTDWFPDRQFEIVRQNEDPLDQMEMGRFGRVVDLRRNLTFVRLNGNLANLIYSMESTNTDFYPYQFKPVLNFLDSPSNNLLIADEVGLGKTIEAGLIWTELRSRIDSRRLMVLCPAMLRQKWYKELKEKFGISADILDARQTLQFFNEYAEGGKQEFNIICSFQGLRPRKEWNEEGEDGFDKAASRLARFLNEVRYEHTILDLLIIDEAHYLRNPESMTSKLGRLLQPVSEHLVLLSATPIHLKSRDLYQLLNLIDEDTFDRPDFFDQILLANKPIIEARDKLLRKNTNSDEIISLLKSAQRNPLLKGNRQLKQLLDNPPTEEDVQNENYRAFVANKIESINLLNHSISRTKKRDVIEARVIRDVVAEEITLSQEEESFYRKVTDLVRSFALQRGVHEGFLLVTPQRQMSSSMAAALNEWQSRRGELSQETINEMTYEDFGEDDTSLTSLGPLTTMLLEQANLMGDVGSLREHDSKYNRLKEKVSEYLNEYTEEKIVLFAFFRPTLLYLDERLKEDGFKCITLMGGDTEKDEIIDRFKDPSGPQILLSSEVASEGIDLQFSRVLINYDLPWNPMKVEQRIGRIDRIGQKYKSINVWNLFYKNTIDSRIYRKLFERLKIFENALGDVEEVLGERIQELTSYLFTHELEPWQEEEQIEQTAMAIANKKEDEDRLEKEAGNLIAHGDYILNQVKAAKELERCITGEDLWIYIRDYFQDNYRGSEFRQIDSEELIFDTVLSEDAKDDFEDFIRDKDLRNHTRLHTAQINPIRCHFKNKVGGEKKGPVEIINQFHPLVRFTTQKIEGLGPSYYHKNVSAKISSSELPNFETGIYVFIVRLWRVEGIRTIEKLSYLAKPGTKSAPLLDEESSERLVTTATRRGRDWLSPQNVINLEEIQSCVDDCFIESEELYSNYIQAIDNENNDRADIQEKSLKSHRRKQKESLEIVKAKHIMNNRNALVRATEGKILALEDRIRKRLRKIEVGRKLEHHPKTSCIGIINIE